MLSLQPTVHLPCLHVSHINSIHLIFLSFFFFFFFLSLHIHVSSHAILIIFALMQEGVVSPVGALPRRQKCLCSGAKENKDYNNNNNNTTTTQQQQQQTTTTTTTQQHTTTTTTNTHNNNNNKILTAFLLLPFIRHLHLLAYCHRMK